MTSSTKRERRENADRRPSPDGAGPPRLDVAEPAPAQPTFGSRRGELVPRRKGQGYRREDITFRRRWLEQKLQFRLRHIGSSTLPGESLKGNIENPIGSVQVPLGIAGPLWVRGEHADDVFYVPMATTEGALVRSYERGMVALTRGGGVEVRIHADENRVCPIFSFETVGQAADFARLLPGRLEALRSIAESTTAHGRLLRLECHPIGREVIVNFAFYTADAHGMNMIVKATEAACGWILEHFPGTRYYIFSGFDAEKRASGSLMLGGKGKKVVAGARIPRNIVRAFLHTTPQRMADVWRHTILGHLQSGAIGYNGHFANGLTAVYIACGQDVANVANSAVGITHLECTPEGDLYASVTLPALTVATVGGGTDIKTSRECLRIMDCHGEGNAPKFAEILTATLLAGEISMAAAMGSAEFVDAHETYGRNPPKPGQELTGEFQTLGDEKLP